MKQPIFLFTVSGLAAGMAFWVLPNVFNVHGYIFLAVLAFGIISAFLGAKVANSLAMSVKTSIILVVIGQLILAALLKIAFPFL